MPTGRAAGLEAPRGVEGARNGPRRSAAGGEVTVWILAVDPQPRGGRAENLAMLLPFAAPGDAVALVDFLCALAAWHRAVGTPGWDEPVDAAAAVLADRPEVAEPRRRGSTGARAEGPKN